MRSATRPTVERSYQPVDSRSQANRVLTIHYLWTSRSVTILSHVRSTRFDLAIDLEW